MSQVPPIASLEQLQVAHFNVVCPTEEEVNSGRLPPLLKLEMLLVHGIMLKWAYVEPRVASALGLNLQQGGEQCASYRGPSGLVIADGNTQQEAERFFDGLNRPQG